MSVREPVEVLVAGHYCHDTLVSKEGVHRVLGGSAAYGSSVLRAAGARFRVVAKVGPDFLYREQVLAEPIVVEGARTTSFIDDYTHGERVGTCEAVCDPIRPEDIEGEAVVAIAAGIAGEVLPATIDRLRAVSRVLLADVQGLIRAIGPRGEVGHLPLEKTPFAASVERLDFLKVSAEEARALDLESLRRRTRVVVTEGKEGCTLLDGASSLHAPAFPAVERDGTGAGDCFLAGLAVGLVRHLPLERALRLANYCGARAVEAVGIPAFDAEKLAEQIR
jgi:1D-myo-inositol 3-kinase